jgi:hypothetical protein
MLIDRLLDGLLDGRVGVHVLDRRRVIGLIVRITGPELNMMLYMAISGT